MPLANLRYSHVFLENISLKHENAFSLSLQESFHIFLFVNTTEQMCRFSDDIPVV